MTFIAKDGERQLAFPRDEGLIRKFSKSDYFHVFHAQKWKYCVLRIHLSGPAIQKYRDKWRFYKMGG